MQFGKSDGINRHYVSLKPFDMSMEVLLKIHQVIDLSSPYKEVLWCQ